MAAGYETKLIAPLFVGAWVNLGAWKDGNTVPGAEAGAWAESLPDFWAQAGNAAVLQHRDAARAAAEQLAATIPEGAKRCAQPSADGRELSVVTFTLAELAEPTPRGAAARERTPDGWVLRAPKQRCEIHAVLGGAAASDPELDRLLSKVRVEVEKKGGALSEVGDFFSFWSFGGRA
jgi:hypothetical protein